MDFELSDDQVALQEAARQLLDAHADSVRVRAHLASGAPYDTTLWQAMVEQGWPGIALPEAQGGVGLGWVETAVLLEEVGRHAAPVPLLPTVVALSALAAAGDPRTMAVGDGSSIGCVAWSRRADAVTAAGSDAAGWTLTGRSDPVVGAAVADVVVVWLPDAVFAVDLGVLGRPKVEPAMDATRTLSWLDLDRTPAVRLGGSDAAADLLNRGAVAVAAQLLGGAARVLEMTAEYAKDRIQFGQPIGSFQAVKHRCADMVVDVEGMRSSAWYGAWAIAAADPEASIAASTAKVWCSDAGRRVMASGLQVHGGIGFTWEHDLHLFLKRAQLDEVTFGDAAYHRDRLADLLRVRVLAGHSVI